MTTNEYVSCLYLDSYYECASNLIVIIIVILLVYDKIKMLQNTFQLVISLSLISLLVL